MVRAWEDAPRYLLLDGDREPCEQAGAAANPCEEEHLLAKEHVQDDHAEPAGARLKHVDQQDKTDSLAVAPLGLEHLTAVEQSLGMQDEQLIGLIKNSFLGSFLPNH